MYDSHEMSKISQNLSLRLSPKKKYPQKLTSCPICCCLPCRCCIICHYLPCRCCHLCHCCPCTCFVQSPSRYISYSPLPNYLRKSIPPNNNLKNSSLMGNTNLTTYYSPSRLRNRNNKINKRKNINKYNIYEQIQFNDFLAKSMAIESYIEKIKINLAIDPDFNCEEVFMLFEKDEKEYLDKDDLKYGLNLIGLDPTDHELRLLMKRFDLQKRGVINYSDFFDIIVPFEKEYRARVENRIPNSYSVGRYHENFSLNTISTLRDLFNYIIDSEKDINNMRKTFGTLRVKLKKIFEFLDHLGRGYFTNNDLIAYLQKEGLMSTIKDADLLFIRLDKNRNGKIDYREVEDEVQTLY